MGNRVTARAKKGESRIATRAPLRDFHDGRFILERGIGSSRSKPRQPEIIPAEVGVETEFQQVRKDEDVEEIEQTDDGADGQEPGNRKGIAPCMLSDLVIRTASERDKLIPPGHGRIAEQMKESLNPPFSYSHERSSLGYVCGGHKAPVTLPREAREPRKQMPLPSQDGVVGSFAPYFNGGQFHHARFQTVERGVFPAGILGFAKAINGGYGQEQLKSSRFSVFVKQETLPGL